MVTNSKGEYTSCKMVLKSQLWCNGQKAGGGWQAVADGFWGAQQCVGDQLHTSQPKNSQLAHSDTDMSVYCRAIEVGFTNFVLFLCFS